jgi:hypothetical protein
MSRLLLTDPAPASSVASSQSSPSELGVGAGPSSSEQPTVRKRLKLYVIQRYERETQLWRDIAYPRARDAYPRYDELRNKDVNGYWRLIEVMDEHT